MIFHIYIPKIRILFLIILKIILRKTQEETWIEGIKNFIDLCIDEERKGNKGAIKCIFPVIENTIKYKRISKNKTKNIQLY